MAEVYIAPISHRGAGHTEINRRLFGPVKCVLLLFFEKFNKVKGKFSISPGCIRKVKVREKKKRKPHTPVKWSFGI